MKAKKIDAYKANARDNAEKTRNSAEITVGDFLYLVTGYGKENGLRDYIRTPERGNGNVLVFNSAGYSEYLQDMYDYNILDLANRLKN